MRETWYVLEDGNVANPADCEIDKKGVLNHKGVAVAMRGNAYSSRGVDLDPDGKPGSDDAPAKAAKNREVKAGKGKAYKTR